MCPHLCFLAVKRYSDVLLSSVGDPSFTLSRLECLWDNTPLCDEGSVSALRARSDRVLFIVDGFTQGFVTQPSSSKTHQHQKKPSLSEDDDKAAPKFGIINKATCRLLPLVGPFSVGCSSHVMQDLHKELR